MRYSLVAYLEILTPAGEPDEVTWESLCERIHRALAGSMEEAIQYERSSLQIDNTIALVQPLDIHASLRAAIGLPFHLFLRLTSLQTHFCSEGVFFRGVVTHGDAMASADGILGPAVRIARLQAGQERMPRITVDPWLLHAIAQDSRLRVHGPAREYAFLKRFLTQDSDGFWYVDYMLGSGHDTNWLNIHARQIEDALAHVDDQSEDARGWLWLATQHDHLVDSLQDIDEATRDSLRVTTDTPLRFRF